MKKDGKVYGGQSGKLGGDIGGRQGKGWEWLRREIKIV